MPITPRSKLFLWVAQQVQTLLTTTWRATLRFARSHSPEQVPNAAQLWKQATQAWAVTIRVLRSVLGWTCIALGMVLLPLPIPLGLVLLIIGVLLVGTRTRVLRLSFVTFKLFLRRWARLNIPLVGAAGRKLLYLQRQVARKYRRQRKQLITGHKE